MCSGIDFFFDEVKDAWFRLWCHIDPIQSPGFTWVQGPIDSGCRVEDTGIRVQVKPLASLSPLKSEILLSPAFTNLMVG